MGGSSAALSRLLSQLLVAFVIEFDNEFEHRMPHTTARGPAAHSGRGPWLTSRAMWSNFLRFIPEGGVPAREIEGLSRLTNLQGMIRWRYVQLEPDPSDPRKGGGIIRPTRAGLRAQRIWRPLAELIQDRWRERFGAERISDLEKALVELAGQFGIELPESLPVFKIGSADAVIGGWAPARPVHNEPGPPDLGGLLSQVLLSFCLDYERTSPLPLPISANALRVLDDGGIPLGDLPARAGVSTEAIGISMTFLQNRQCVVIEPNPKAARGKVARLTGTGRILQAEHPRLLLAVENGWRTRFGDDHVERLVGCLQELMDQRDDTGALLSKGLVPYPEGWRAHPPYRNLTRTMIAHPAEALPHYPMVLHRGGFPDGS